ncbi:MAG: type II toxin-antitoxin system RelE/ParE family toxin [Chloroflexi bacterium]|nr:type II toxin-antitoxin system RelE/ParE family toxin [Chloroflexota bacterium]
MYEVGFTPRARREFEKLAANDQKRLDAVIGELENNPRPIGVKKLSGVIHRIRVGEWRVIYAILDRERRIAVVKIARRSEDTYDRLKDLF